MPKKRGRKPKLSPELQKEICEHLAHGYTVTTVCEIVGISERSYYAWCSEKKHFSQATTRAIGESTKFLHHKLRLSDDWRSAAFLLERRWPNEYGKVEHQLPDEPEPKKVSIAVVLNTGGKTLEELVNFPMCSDASPPAPEQQEQIDARRPIPTASGRVIWTDELLPPDDADPNGELP
jgi:transposase